MRKLDRKSESLVAKARKMAVADVCPSEPERLGIISNALVGSMAFGVPALIAGYVWIALEFPFAIVAPAAIGWYVVSRRAYGGRTAAWAALFGGVTFTLTFIVAVFLALTDGSPFAPTAWLSATLAAGAAGAVTGWLLGRVRGALAIALFSAAGMFAAAMLAGLMRSVAPSSVDVEGFAQTAYFSIVQGLIGAIVGAAVGGGVAWLKSRDSGIR